MAINLGNIVGNTIIGIASNLDSTALVEELSSIRQRPIDDLEIKIEANSGKISKYAELKTLLNDLKSSVDFLRNPPDAVLNPYANVFDYTEATLSSATLTSSSYLSVTANPGATPGDTAIEIGTLAESLEQRSGSFNTRSGDATTTASGSYFTAGTFSIGAGVTQSVTGDTLDGYSIASSDYSVDGSVSGIVTSIDNFVVTGGSGGLTGLQGGFSSFGGSYDGGSGTITITFSRDGVVYTSNAITADDSVNGGANTGILAGTVITFTGDSGGDNETSFDITLASDITIDADAGNTTTFLDNLVTGLSDVSIYQSRQISNFTDANVKSPFSSLTTANVKFVSNEFDNDTGEFGSISDFNVKYSTGSDGAISVLIDGETFRVTGLGTTLNTNLTLTSTTTSKQLQINIGDAGDSIDISDSDAAVALEKALGYAFGTRELVDITVESGDSLNDIAFAINQLSADTGLAASIIQVDEFDYRLSLKAVNEGKENSFEFFDGSGVLTNASITTIQDAENSVFRVDGIEVERSSNTITDVIEDVTLELLQITPDYGEVTPDTINVTIDNDIDTIVTGVVTFLDAYNAVKVFHSEQNQTDENYEYLEDSVLGGDRVMQSFIDQLVSEINGLVGNASDNDFDSLSDVGIVIQDYAGDSETPETSNILSYDENELRAVLAANFDKVRSVFETNVITGDSSLAITQTSNAIELYEFKLEIDTSADEGEQVKLLNSDGTDYLDEDNNNVYLDISGTTITGQTGTVLDGIEFLYTGDGNDTISVEITQGIADRVYNLTETYVEDDGLIDASVESLTDLNTDYSDDIDALEIRLESYVETLRAQFTALESAIASVNNILSFLEADSNARNNN